MNLRKNSESDDARTIGASNNSETARLEQDADLEAVVAAWRGLAPEVRAAIVRLAKGEEDRAMAAVG